MSTYQEPHAFDPGGRAHWYMPRCCVCWEFADHPVHHGGVLAA
jgi:hypothetical protein